MNNKTHSQHKETARAPARSAQADPALRTEHASLHPGLRDPHEPTQGPLRLDDLNYSPERLTLPEGNDNVYGDDEAAAQDEDELRPGTADPPFPERSQSDILDSLPEADSNEARSDLVILGDINDLLAALSHTDATAIEVSVRQGTVTLEGQVSDADTCSRVAQAIEAIPGVEEICNRLAVR